MTMTMTIIICNCCINACHDSSFVAWHEHGPHRTAPGSGSGSGMACNTLRQSFVLSNRNEYVKIYNSYEARIDVGRSTIEDRFTMTGTTHFAYIARVSFEKILNNYRFLLIHNTCETAAHTSLKRERQREIEREGELERDDNKSRRIKSVFNIVVNSAKRNLTSSPSPSLSVSPRTD